MDIFSFEGKEVASESNSVTLLRDGVHYNAILDIPYLPDDVHHHIQHHLDVYVPTNERHPLKDGQKYPVVMHLHGGGWVRGGRNQEFYGAPYIARNLAWKGVVCVAVSYRTGCSFPEPISDVASAFKWIVDMIEHYNGDPENIFVCGHSAGGHLASLLSTDSTYLNQVGASPKQIKGCVCVSGIYTVGSPLAEDPSALPNVFYRGRYVDSTFGGDPAVWDYHSPITHIKTHVNEKPLPPFLILNAAFDLGLEYDGKRFFTELKKWGHEAQWFTVPQTHHQSITIRETTVTHILDFIRKYGNTVNETSIQ